MNSNAAMMAVYVGGFFFLILFTTIFTRRVQWKWVGIALAYITLDIAVSLYGSQLNQLLPFAVNWNWGGKFASILLGVTILWRYPDVRREAGAVCTQRPGSLAVSIVSAAALALAAVYFGMHRHPEPFNAETLLFQFFMPSISEEIAYRGILLALLTRALGNMGSIRTRPISYGVPIIIIFFGFAHGAIMLCTADASNLPWAAAAWATVLTGMTGAILMLVRVSSGSLLVPIFLHTLFNVTTLAIPMLALNR